MTKYKLDGMGGLHVASEVEVKAKKSAKTKEDVETTDAPTVTIPSAPASIKTESDPKK